MLNAIGEAPRTARDIERIRVQAKLAMDAVTWLIAEDFQPLEIMVQKDRRTPIVRIALSPRCTWLRSEFDAYKFELTAKHVTWRAKIMGVRVQWTERGN